MRQVQIIVGFISALGAFFAHHQPLFAILPLFGSGLMFAGVTGTCGMALVLAKMPWNQAQSCSLCETGEDL